MRAEHFRKQKPKWFTVGRHTKWLSLIVGVLVFASGFDWYQAQRRHTASGVKSVSINSGASASGDTLLASKNILPVSVRGARTRRVVYPYSLIPGGIHSVAELKNAIANDAVVSAEYASFRLSRARIIRLDRQRTMHVSYRLGDRVYWTKRELTLAKGETLITDGELTARTKCGNMIAETTAAMSQVSANEPTAQALDTPVVDPNVPNADSISNSPGEVTAEDQFPELALATYSNVPPVIFNSPPMSATTPSAGANSYSGGGTEPSIFRPAGPSGQSPYPAVPATSLVVRTPEPGTAVLLLTALLALFYLQKRKQKDAPKPGN
jgi:hypothetical protein